MIMVLLICTSSSLAEASWREGNKACDVTEITSNQNSVDELDVRKKYEILTKSLIHRQLTVTTMESCTSGQVASLITDTEGSSAVLKGAFVTYSNEAKIMQGVPKETIEAYGVYSAETAAAMAVACRNTYKAGVGIGVTGSFGNTDPSNSDSIPGEVFFSIADSAGTECYHCHIPVQSSRLHYKLYTANLIVEQLQKKIKTTDAIRQNLDKQNG